MAHRVAYQCLCTYKVCTAHRVQEALLQYIIELLVQLSHIQQNTPSPGVQLAAEKRGGGGSSRSLVSRDVRGRRGGQ